MQLTRAGSLGDVPLPPTRAERRPEPVGRQGTGCSGRYWNNGDFQGAPALTQADPTVDVAGTPRGLGPVWSARWTGTLTPPESGLYRCSLLQAGIAKLYVDGRLVAAGYREGTAFVAGPQYPRAGRLLPHQGAAGAIRVDYSSKSGLFGTLVQLHVAAALGLPASPPPSTRRSADAAMVFANIAQGEGMDRTTLALPGDQDALIDAVAAANRTLSW